MGNTKSSKASSDANSRNLRSLSEVDKVRDKGSVILGTKDEKGALHTIKEVVDNSVDEAAEGYGDKIIVSMDENYVVTVQDFGRGLPMHYNENEKKYNWECALCTLYSSGKYDGAMYGNAVGTNGLGLTATQFASEFMDVTSVYDGTKYFMHFEKGYPKTDLITEDIGDKTIHGTKIRFKPDVEVFPALMYKPITADMLIEYLNTKAMLNRGLTIQFSHPDLNHELTFYYERGIEEYIDKLLDEEKHLLPKAEYYEDSYMGQDKAEAELGLDDYNVHIETALNFCRDKGFSKIYHNSVEMIEGGESVDGYTKGVVRAFTEKARELNKLASNDGFIYKDIEDIIVSIVSVSMPGYRTQFKGQTKFAITNEFVGYAVKTFIYKKLMYLFDSNKTLAQRVIEEAIINKTAREEGAALTKSVIKKLSSSVNFRNKPKKFRDCTCKQPAKRELYIVEGDSALTSTKLACDPYFQAMLPLRGKTVNCRKEKISRALTNDTITDLYRVLGCGIDVKNDKNLEDIPPFDISKLQYNKIIICTDADVDGHHIKCLVLVMILTLSPELIKQGKVYIALTPLFEISYKGGIRFAFSEQEKEEILDELRAAGYKDSNIRVQRSKGLGENDADMMWQSTMNPETRRLIQIEYPEDEAHLRSVVDALLGDDIEMRRILIDKYFDSTDDNLD